MARRPRRTFPAEFQAEVVPDLLAGNPTRAEVCREHRLSPTLPAPWTATLLERLPAVFRTDDRRAAGADRTAGLERLVGRPALESSAFADARGPLGRFPDAVDNRERIPSALGYLTPAGFEQPWRAGQTASPAMQQNWPRRASLQGRTSHVPAQEEREAAEHLLPGQTASRPNGEADPVGKILVEAHGAFLPHALGCSLHRGVT